MCLTTSFSRPSTSTISLHLVVGFTGLEQLRFFIPYVNVNANPFPRSRFFSLPLFPPSRLFISLSLSLSLFASQQYTFILLDTEMNSSVPPWRVSASAPTSKPVAFQPSGKSTHLDPASHLRSFLLTLLQRLLPLFQYKHVVASLLINLPTHLPPDPLHNPPCPLRLNILDHGWSSLPRFASTCNDALLPKTRSPA